MAHPDSSKLYDKIRAELDLLDDELLPMEGKFLKPSQCYYLDADPPYVLFNSDCPEAWREKIEIILLKYLPPDETRA
jgi:hypothetical protein